MGDARTDLLQGTLDLIVLRLLRGGPASNSRTEGIPHFHRKVVGGLETLTRRLPPRL